MSESNFANNRILLLALKKGEEKAFIHLYDTHYHNLLSYAIRILNDKAESEDCVHAVFCKLWDDRINLTINESIKSYLFRSVYNKCIDNIRHRKVTEKYLDKELSDLYYSRVIQQPEAECKLYENESIEALMQATEKLPPKCKEVFISCKFEELSYDETATKLGISIKTVENQLAIAMSRLREMLIGIRTSPKD